MTVDDPNDAAENVIDEGISLRDYFASQAIATAWSIERVFGPDGTELYDGTAQRAYSFADAMLKARQK